MALCVFLVIIVHSPELLFGLNMIHVGGISRIFIDKFTMRMSLFFR